MPLGSTTGDHEYLLRTSLLVAAFTVILTTNFIGSMALLTDQAPGAAGRLPYYVLLAAFTFVATIMILEESRYDGRSVLTASVTAAILGFVLISLGGEGIIFVVRNPGDILISELLIYFITAAAIGTGLGYWVLRHWREFARGEKPR